MELIPVVILVLLFTVMNGLHVLLPFLFQPPNTLFTGIAHYYQDYFFYISHIVDGMKGSLLVSQRFTNEPLSKLWTYWFNASLGYFGKFFTHSPFLIYNASLALLVFGIGISWYILIRKLFPRSPALRLLALLFVLSATNMYDIASFFTGGTVSILGTFWFSPAPALNRLGGAPHHAIQSILIIAEILILNTLLKNPARKPVWQWLVCVIITLWLTSMNPMQMLLLICVGGIFVLGRTIHMAYGEKHVPALRTVFHQYIPIMLTGALALPIAIALTGQMTSPLYAIAQQWEYFQSVPVSVLSFIQAIGISVVFLPFAVLPSLRVHKSRLLALCALYLGLAQLFFWSPIPGIFHVSRVRFLQPVNYGLIPLFAAIGFSACVQYCTLVIQRLHLPFTRQTIRTIVAVFLLGVYLFFTIPSLVMQIRERTDPALTSLKNKSPLNHVPMGVVKALDTLDQLDLGNMPVVVTDPILPYDTLIPAYTGKTSFTGHIIHTMYLSEKEGIRAQLFSPATSNQEAEKIIKNHRIGALFVSAKPDGRPSLIARYPFVRRVFGNDEIVIFTVR